MCLDSLDEVNPSYNLEFTGLCTQTPREPDRVISKSNWCTYLETAVIVWQLVRLFCLSCRVFPLLTISNSFISLPFPPAECCQPDVVTDHNREIPLYYGPIIRPIGFTCLIGCPTGCNTTRCLHQLVSRHNELVLPFYCTSSH